MCRGDGRVKGEVLGQVLVLHSGRISRSRWPEPPTVPLRSSYLSLQSATSMEAGGGLLSSPPFSVEGSVGAPGRCRSVSSSRRCARFAAGAGTSTKPAPSKATQIAGELRYRSASLWEPQLGPPGFSLLRAQ